VKVFEFNDSPFYLVTFGSGKVWRPAVKRLINQAGKSSRFGKVIAFDEEDVDPEILGLDLNFFQNNPRGYGLWIWKPHIVAKTMEMFPECRIIFYLDAGCEINTHDVALARLDHIFTECLKFEGVAFELPFLEKNWTSNFVLVKMDAVKLSSTKQIAGGIFLMTNTDENRKFLSQWFQWMTKDNSKYLVGAESENLDGILREHRFDQSIFSILWKLNRKHVLPDESFWAPNWRKDGQDYPIWATRSKLRISFAANSCYLFCYRVIRLLLRKISKEFLVI